MSNSGYTDLSEEMSETDGDFLRLLVKEFNGESTTSELKNRCGYSTTESVKARARSLAELGLVDLEDRGTDKHGRPRSKGVRVTFAGREAVENSRVPGDGSRFERTDERVRELENRVEYLELVLELVAEKQDLDIKRVDDDIFVEERDGEGGEEVDDAWADVDVF